MKNNCVSCMVALCCMLFFPISGRCDDLIIDGNWWNGLTESGKITAIPGFIVSFQSGWSQGALDDNARIDNDLSLYEGQGKISRDQEKGIIADIVWKKLRENYQGLTYHYPTFSKTFGAYSALIDSYYATHPGKMTTSPGDILDCLTDTPDEPYCKNFLGPIQ